jgi:hypothetical protein
MGNNHNVTHPRHSAVLENIEYHRRLRLRNQNGNDWNGRLSQYQPKCPSLMQPMAPVISCVPIGNPVPACTQPPPYCNLQPQFIICPQPQPDYNLLPIYCPQQT